MTRRRWVFSTAALTVMAVCASAQTPAAGTGAVSGRVVDARTNEPIAKAIVTLFIGGIAPARVLTDASGEFALDQLPAGNFSLAAAKPGFLGGGLGQRTMTDLSTPLTLAAGDRHAGVTLKLWRAGAITGAVTNDVHEPLANVQVQALRRAFVGGQWAWIPGPSVVTDDRGRYRISGLTAATYVVVARPDLDVETPLLLALLSANPASAADIMAGVVAAHRGPEVGASVEHDTPAFYSTGGAGMTSIDVAGERAGIDIHLARVHTVRVAGHVAPRAGANASIEGLAVRLVPAAASGRAPLAEIELASAACDETGQFEFSAVPPGRYVIEAIRTAPPPGAPPNPPPASPTLWGSAPLTVRAGVPVTDVTLRVDAGHTVSGHIARDDSGAQLDFSTTTLRLDAADAPMAGAAAAWVGRPSVDGRFVMADVAPGRYLLRVTNLPRGLTLHRATANNRDVLDEPFTIANADVPDVTVDVGATPLGAIGGRVDPQATVVVFPQAASWRLDTSLQARRTRAVRPTSDGRFTIGNLPSGEYLVAAVAKPLPTDWQAPGRLQILTAHASRVHASDGETATIDPVVIK